MAAVAGPKNWIDAAVNGQRTDLLADDSPWEIRDLTDDEQARFDTATAA